MKIDQIIRKLLPHDEHFYALLEESAHNLIRAGKELNRLPVCKTQAQRVNAAKRIKEVEHEGDSITHRIFSELNSTFVTPLDREDIHELASALDDILDQMDGCANRFALYKITRVPKAVAKLIDVLNHSIAELERGVHLLRNLNEVEEIQNSFKKINEYKIRPMLSSIRRLQTCLIRRKIRSRLSRSRKYLSDWKPQQINVRMLPMCWKVS